MKRFWSIFSKTSLFLDELTWTEMFYEHLNQNGKKVETPGG